MVTVTCWQPSALPDAIALEPVPPVVAPADAQNWCNFVVHMPGAVPAECTVLPGTLRREAPPGRPPGAEMGRTPWSTNNPAAYRFEVVAPGRRLRVKQFLYDWAFPALDHPSLWKSRTYATPIDNRYVAWIGVDYLGHRGASARLRRTTVEVSTLAGEFTDAEILRLYRSLRPVSSAAAAEIAATPFAALSYCARYPATMVSVPAGLWAFRRGSRADRGVWVTGDEAAALASAVGAPAALGGFPLDCAARFGGDTGHEEVEVLYASRPDRGHELRLVVQRLGRGRLSFPPDREPHPCWAGMADVAGLDVFLAFIDPRYGPFDATWRDEAAGVEVKLLSSTGVGQGRGWFLTAAADLVAALRTA
jgi:hypothetical protein